MIKEEKDKLGMRMVIWDKGKPIATTDKKEAERLRKRIKIIDEVLKSMGYEEGYAKYQEYIEQMTSEGFDKYVAFLQKVDELAKKRGC